MLPIGLLSAPSCNKHRQRFNFRSGFESVLNDLKCEILLNFIKVLCDNDTEAHKDAYHHKKA